MKYPKIHSLWKRNEFSKRVIEGDYSLAEFESIKRWTVYEKIDGTNIRLHYKSGDADYKIYGRSDDSSIPRPLEDYLRANIKLDDIITPLEEFGGTVKEITIFGEGYGGNIQTAGPFYSDKVGFIIFDVHLNGWWLKRDDYMDVAKYIKMPVVPMIGFMGTQEIVDHVKSYPKSFWADKPYEMEGIVAKSFPLMRFRDGDPIMFKLKAKDMRDLCQQ